MTAPLTRVRPGYVNLSPVDPEDQDAAAVMVRYPRGAVVRLGKVDGVVLAHCVEQDAEGEDKALAVIVHVADGCPDAGVTRIWRTAQIVDSPLPEDHRASLSLEALSARTPQVVQAILYGWPAQMPGSVDQAEDPVITIGQKVRMSGRVGYVCGFTPGSVMVVGPRVSGAEEWPRRDITPDDAEEPEATIPAGVLAEIDDVSLCAIRVAAADGKFGAHGYAFIHDEFARRRSQSTIAGQHRSGTEQQKLRGALFHYAGLLADTRDGVA